MRCESWTTSGDGARAEPGIVIGEPVTRIPLDGPERKPQFALWNPIHLSPGLVCMRFVYASMVGWTLIFP